jgi:hypothetical protein
LAAEFFGISVSAFIGPNDSPGTDEFRFFVCSPRWLQDDPPPKSFEFLRGHLLLTRWDYATLYRAIGDLCAHTEGENWFDVATKLSRYAIWEDEDRKE